MAVILLQRPRTRVFYACLALIVFVSGAVAQQTPQQDLPVIPISAALRDSNGDFMPDQLGQPVAIQGVVTSDPMRSGTDTWLLNLQDSTAGILLVTHNSELFRDLRAGDAVRVRGILSQYKGAEELQTSEIERVGRQAIPPAKQVLAADLQSKRYLGQRVHLEGEIQEKADPQNGTDFVLRDRSGDIPIFLPAKLLLDGGFLSRMRTGGKADVIGMLGQYSEQPPFNSGFRVVLLTKDGVRFAPVPPWRLLLPVALAVASIAVLFYISLRRRRAERERAFAEADEQRRLLDAVIRKMPSGAVVVGANGEILVRNDQALRLWQGREALLERFTRRALRETDSATEEEIQFANYDGIKWLRVATAAIHDHKGRVFAGVVICYDLTDLKRTEATLRLAEKVAVTGRLAAAIAHEINNPLAAVTNLLYLTQASPTLTPEVRDYVTLAQRELARVAHIVKQTLSFYQSEATPVLVEIRELIDSATEICASHAERRGIRIVKEYMPVRRIKVYSNEVRQLVCNILLNAIEAAKHAVSIRVYESQDWRDPLVHGVRISIADDGPGIPRENRDQIFEPFFTTKGVKGTGLGLWVGRNIVQKHGGEIHVRSCHWPEASITCFSVFLPYEVVEKARHSPTSAVSEALNTKQISA